MRGRRLGKPEAYSLEYVEDFPAAEHDGRWSRIVPLRSRMVNASDRLLSCNEDSRPC